MGSMRFYLGHVKRNAYIAFDGPFRQSFLRFVCHDLADVPAEPQKAWLLVCSNGEVLVSGFLLTQQVRFCMNLQGMSVLGQSTFFCQFVDAFAPAI